MNPFVFGKIVEAPHFCPRKALVDDLQDAVDAGQNTVLYGRRRVGKSSLVLHTAKKTPERIFLLIDLFFTKDAAMFLDYCTTALFAFNSQRAGLLEKGVQALKRIRPKIEIDPQTGTPSLSLGISRDEPENLLNTIDDFFGFLASEFEPDQLIVCFDEFQSVLKYPDAERLLAKIRGQVQYHKFPYIFTGSDRSGLKSIFADQASPFYKSVRAIEIGTLERDDFQPFLNDKFKAGKRTVADHVWDSIFKLEVTGDIQQLCSALWQSSESGSLIDQATLTAAYDRIFAQEIEGFRSTLGNLSALQFRVLKAVAHSGIESLYSRQSQQSIEASASSIRRSVTALTEKWILIKNHEKIFFNNPFLQLFITEKRI